MEKIDYSTLYSEIEKILAKEQSIVLATSFDNKVTARTMSHVNDGLTIYFQTDKTSVKAEQIKNNTQIALAVGNIQIEAIAEVCGHPKEHRLFSDLYKSKYPHYYDIYSSLEDEIVIEANPIKITLYKYVNGKPCREILDITHKNAYRI